VNIFFVLSKQSSDWNRLKSEGFKLLDFKSKRHLMAVLNAKYIISSHADRFIKTPLPTAVYGDVLKYKFIFLQHGVTQSDISRWFNFIMPEILITATKDEYSSIVSKRSRYRVSEKEVRLTGFPRHDHLDQLEKSNDYILIMPTWREYLISLTDDHGGRKKLSGFVNSDYATHWLEILKSEELKNLSSALGKQVVFCPHPIMKSYLGDLDIPEHISIYEHKVFGSLQNIFVKSSVLLTDYSSIGFEFAYLNKPVVYYQFDSVDFFTKHTLRKGYYDHERDGFGPVCYSKEQVFESLDRAISGNLEEVFEERRIEAFSFRDGKCSERVFNAILEIA